MNEFTLKKLGEVLAFSRVGSETFTRGMEALRSGLGEDAFEKAEDMFANLSAELERRALADESGTVLRKADGTSDKLRSMRDMYVGDEWDNPAELLEWLGFFVGAAIVHWRLVEGASKALDKKEMSDLSGQGLLGHENLFRAVEGSIARLGAGRALE